MTTSDPIPRLHAAPAERVAAARPQVYGLDIETDTAVGGLDPTRARILAVAVVTAARELVFTGPERELLAELDTAMASLEPGVIATWNGSAFDLPFIVDRARRCDIDLGIGTWPDSTLRTRTPLPGHTGSYRGTWFSHRHLDVYRVYSNDLKRTLDVSCSLKSVASVVGLPHIVEDASRVHELDESELRRYVASDARVTRQLALRRWATASRFVDSAPGLASGSGVA